ncbi:MAG: DUF1998 domain-containing protein [Sandaracinaceae bacterium]|nr:DUF1998 domain-containing protein [Sandaracinaceae bacterium]
MRRSQVITTYGPGAMVDLVDNAVLVGGLDFWSYDKKKASTHIAEPRLRELLGERFKGIGRELSIDKPFRAPPLCDDREPTRYAGIQVLEFPQWFVCQNPECRALVRKHDGLEHKRGRYWHACGGKRAFECVPVRFLGACRRGHVQEWPWISWAHLGRPMCAAASLRLEEGASGDFAEVRVVCACGASQSLATAAARRVEMHCDGHRPWLGVEGREECDEMLRLLVRTASNSYFAQVMSALSIPEPARRLDDAIAEQWSTLKVATAESLPVFRTIPHIQVALGDASDADVLAAIRAKQEGRTAARDPLRTAEFKQLVSQPREQTGELPPPDAKFFAREANVIGALAPGLRRVVVAPKLREVRVQIGFTRLEPATPNLQGEFDLAVESAPLGLTTNWLPATEIRGEGVLVQLDEAAVQAWEDRAAVKARADELRAGYDARVRALSAEAQSKAPPFPGVRFYMLHSLSHLLISAISLECGYSASAIRERIYCGPSASDPSTPMAAILLSTGTSGTEGTLGGLVEQGRRIREHLERAYDLGRLCANDPVCAGHSPEEDPTERYLEGAACHGCLFVAECSCEWFNRYLDRALVVPTVGRLPSAEGEPGIAFFGARP